MAKSGAITQFRNSIVRIAIFLFTECSSGVTICTIFGRSGMSARFSGCDYTIMTSIAAPQDLGMVHIDGCPNGRPMTGFTDIGRSRMISRLARHRGAVVATGAIGRDSGVAESRRQPCIRLVAAAAIRRSSDVRWRLSSRRIPVVTASAGPKRLGVIHTDRSPHCCNMAEIAAICRFDMRCRFARCLGAVMARHAGG
jgi:hypothetical protein